MLAVLGFLIVLGPLVVVHEFGHYIFARVFGVKAEIFSIGFGPKLWSKQLGETELRFSAIPLGGYVKLLGEDPEVQLSPADQARALQKQAPWKRFFIFFGGPFFNFLMAVVIFMAILVIGEDQIASFASRVVRGSYAEKVGFQSGDQILSIDQKPVKRFEEVLVAVNESPGRSLQFEVIHPGVKAPTVLNVIPAVQEGFSIYGEVTQVGELDGLLPTARSIQAGISNPESPAGRAGIITGDSIKALNGAPVSNWEGLERLYALVLPGAEFSLKLESISKAVKEITLKKSIAPNTSLDAVGLYSSELFVEKTISGSPAELAGIKPGDRLVVVGDRSVQSFFELREAVQRAGEKDGKVNVRWERDGKLLTAVFVPTASNSRDPLLKKTVQYTIGVVPMLTWTAPPTIKERILNPFTLVYKATERTVDFSWRNLVSLQKMVVGEVSIATLGGPILIGKIAGESLSRGVVALLTTMAILSIGLAILNILPVPVLDGGHLMLLGLEMIRGKPLTLRQMEIVQQVGLSLILLLMIIVIRNDLARLPLFN